MTSTYVADIHKDRPAVIPWTAMPIWFHIASFAYFATNTFNGWGTVYLNVPLLPTALVLFGLIGGFVEHLSPYFPKLYVSPLLEKCLFRIPTALGFIWVGVYLGLAWFVVTAFIVQGIIFIQEKPLTSMEPRFHIQHVFVTHIFGSFQMYVLILIAGGEYPALNFLVAG
jgi:hypothetical protein